LKLVDIALKVSATVF